MTAMLTLMSLTRKIIVNYCDNFTSNVSESEILFQYHEVDRRRSIKIYRDVESYIEIKIGAAVCSSVAKDIDVSDEVGCNGGSKLFDKSIKCLYKRDQAGFMLGCNTGAHLQNCRDFICPPNTVKCLNSFCLPLEYVCDGEKQCPGGEDEIGCGCFQEGNEIVLMTENEDFDETYVKNVAKQFSALRSIFRVLRYKVRKDPTLLEYEHLFLDISDTEVNAYDIINREYMCHYTVLASNFINSIQFSKNNSRGLVFLQKSEVSKLVAEMMFKNIRSSPDFHVYRVVENLNISASKLGPFAHVIEVSVKHWSHLTSIGSSFFPMICKKHTAMFCPNDFKCMANTKCISMDQMCDGKVQCINHDDEKMCD
ncbi:uncharacterized protein LOC132746086 [Ruditapes philippinarum]|uniref:uncharacterized protein LOC132746086 n=1 Tax=Ruditapes philippinarum TaxID=129788 RepID=UPI00295C06BA|nr:uncharacterized protein LOC132746086 [Ruditapes philippinarum]